MFFTGALIKCEIFLTNFIIIVDFIYDYLGVFGAGVVAGDVAYLCWFFLLNITEYAYQKSAPRIFKL